MASNDWTHHGSYPCRTYIVYSHALFAQGVRSVLEQQDGVQIVGMESNIGKALKAVQHLRPEVVLVEEPSATRAQWPFLQLATAGRVVTMSLDHAFATVYDQRRIPASDPVRLAKAIRGTGTRKQAPGAEEKPPQRANSSQTRRVRKLKNRCGRGQACVGIGWFRGLRQR